MKLAGVLTFALLILATLRVAALRAEPLENGPGTQAPQPQIVEGPDVRVLTGLTAQQFQEEMNFMVQGLGVTCGTCHVRGNFASEDKPQKQTARKMLEMVKAINKMTFPDYQPKDGESLLGKVTCYTCHRGETTPKSSVGHH